MTFSQMLAAAVLASAALPVIAAEPLPFRPDEAVLACQARGLHAVQAEEGRDARADRRFKAERHDQHMWHVSGQISADFEGERRPVSIECDVSSDGVEVVTMLITR